MSVKSSVYQSTTFMSATYLLNPLSDYHLTSSNNPLNKIVCVLPLIQLPSLKVIVLGHSVYP